MGAEEYMMRQQRFSELLLFEEWSREIYSIV